MAKPPLKFKKGMAVIKLPLENPEHACVIRIIHADKSFAYGSDQNKYHQSNGRCSGRKVLNHKDIIQLPPFGYSAEEEAERLRNIATRNKEFELEQLEHQQSVQRNSQIEAQQHALETFAAYKSNWKKARNVKTSLGRLKTLEFQIEGQYKGDVATCVMLILIKPQNNAFVGYGAILAGITSDLYVDTLARHASVEVSGETIPETVGNLILKATQICLGHHKSVA